MRLMKIRTLLNEALTRTSAYLATLDWMPRLTRARIGAFGVTLVAVGLALGGLERTPPADAAMVVEALALPERPAIPEPTARPTVDEALAGIAPTPPQSLDGWDSVEVRPGQTLDGIFRGQDFSVSLLHEILALDADTKRLTRIRPGDVFDFQRYPDGSLRRMRYPVDEDAYLLVDVNAEGPVASRLRREIFSEPTEAEGRIDSSLFAAAKAAGMSDAMTMQLAEIFGWDIDFVLEIREGDRFFVIYEKIYRDGEYLRDGDILAATFVNQGQRFQALRHEDEDGVAHYFAPDGRPMKKAFLRAPLNFSYISSNFNPRRFHPILKRVKAHNGIDYRAPTGTPVYAAGGGKVIKSAYDKFNGHHVFIQHPGSIVTKYLHFTKRNVKNGQAVKQGQVIGYVGSTGMSTAPHLHYEFVVNGVHRDPRTVPLPKAEPLQGSALASFQAESTPFLNRLGRLETASLYASRE